jgi:aminoglycoside 2'-N-acetyltransferase I
MHRRGKIMELSVLADSELSTHDRLEIDTVCDRAFNADQEEDPSYGIQWVAHNDWHVVAKLEGAILSHVGIVERTGSVDGHPVKLGGVGAVATLPEFQKKGFASSAMTLAAGFMRDSLKVDFGLLVCARGTVPFYHHLGWQEVAGPLVFDQPHGKVTYPEVTMVLPCARQDWPPGTIDLCGLPW